MSTTIIPSLGLLDQMQSTEISKVNARLLMRNPHGPTVYAGLFGQHVPPHVYAEAMKTSLRIAAGTLDEREDAISLDVPRYASLGDAMRLADAEESVAIEAAMAGALKGSAIPYNTSIDQCGSEALADFELKVIRPNVVDRSAWTRSDTMMVALILFSYRDFEPTLYQWYGKSIGPGVVMALQRYRLANQSDPLSLRVKNFNLALILYILRHTIVN